MKRRLLISLSGLLTASTWAATNLPPLTASELLDKFAATQEQLKSFVAQYEMSQQDSETTARAWKGSHSGSGETRFDGQRCSTSTRLWGQITPNTVRSKAEPYYKSRLFDGQWRFGYEQAFWRVGDPRARPGYAGTLTLQRPSPPPRNLIELLDLTDSGLALCLGVLPWDDGKRFDVRLREATTIQVRDKLELAGAEPSPCHVLEGETAHGHYTVWLDPAHGFQMAKAILLRRAGHQRGADYRLTAGERDLCTVDEVRFAKAGSVWVPVDGSWGLDNTLATGESNSSRGQLKVTKFLLNPDRAALGSFGLDDIRNGARVVIVGATNAHGGLIKYQWRDGKVLDSAGNVAFDSGSKSADPDRPARNDSPGARQP
jgi:hypothetical protein